MWGPVVQASVVYVGAKHGSYGGICAPGERAACGCPWPNQTWWVFYQLQVYFFKSSLTDSLSTETQTTLNQKRQETERTGHWDKLTNKHRALHGEPHGENQKHEHTEA